MLLGCPPGANLHLRPPQQIVNRPSQSLEVVPGKPSASLHPVWRKRHPPVHEATGGHGFSRHHLQTPPPPALCPTPVILSVPSVVLLRVSEGSLNPQRRSSPREGVKSVVTRGSARITFHPLPRSFRSRLLPSQVRTCAVKVRPTSLNMGRQAQFTPFFAPIVHKTGTSGAPGSLNGIKAEKRWRCL